MMSFNATGGGSSAWSQLPYWNRHCVTASAPIAPVCRRCHYTHQVTCDVIMISACFRPPQLALPRAASNVSATTKMLKRPIAAVM
jgi:hypothetical protein